MSAASDKALTSAFLSCASERLQHRLQPSSSVNLRCQATRTRLQPLKQPLRLPQQLQDKVGLLHRLLLPQLMFQPCPMRDP